MKVLVALSGGVDSSVAAAELIDAGHDVVGITMRLWGGESDTGCCSVADVDDARRVAQQLDIDHLVFNFTEDFDARVVEPYVAAHRDGLTPNPCIECNRHLKFDRFLARATQLGFDTIATGHHARVEQRDGVWRVVRGADGAKDQSYVLSMLGQRELPRVLLPIGTMSKADVRAVAERLGLRTAAKPDSQDVCFIAASAGGRTAFLGDRIPMHPARVVDRAGVAVGEVAAVELVTIGQRRGLGGVGGGDKRYAVDVDVAGRTVVVGDERDLLVDEVTVAGVEWTGPALGNGDALLAQASAHGRPFAVRFLGGGRLACVEPQRRVAPGQTVALYDGDAVVGAGIAT